MVNLENLVLYVAFTMGKASSLDLSTDFCKSAFHGGLLSHMQNVLTSTGTSMQQNNEQKPSDRLYFLGGFWLWNDIRYPSSF